MTSTPRRTFLRQLVSLPLIGGAVSLVGEPTAAAEPATQDLLEAYKTWLHYEKRFLLWEMADDPVCMALYQCNPNDARTARAKVMGSTLWHVGDSGYSSERGAPSTRAELVLSAVGCDWREDRS